MDSLSFSRQQHRTLEDLARIAIDNLGFPKSNIGRLEQNATVKIQLYGLPDIMLSVLNDRLWVWSCLMDLADITLSRSAEEILSILIRPIPGLECGQAILQCGESGYELKALVNIEFIQQDHGLSTVLDQFRGSLKDICSLP